MRQRQPHGSSLRLKGLGLASLVGTILVSNAGTVYADDKRFEMRSALAQLEVGQLRHQVTSATRVSFSQEVILPDTPEIGAEFGTSVALQETTLVVGAHRNSNGKGAAYIMEKGAQGWTQLQRLEPETLGLGARFGASVAIDGEWLAVGAPNDTGASMLTGAVYMYKRESDGQWRFNSKVYPEEGALSDRFGASLSLLDGRLLVGAPLRDAQGQDSGAAYLFTLSDSVWSLNRELIPDNLHAGDNLGKSVTLAPSHVGLGAPNYDDGIADSGAVFVYSLENGSSASAAVRITPAAREAGMLFGNSLSFHGDHLAVGAPRSGVKASFAGAVHLFRRNGATWAESSLLFPISDQSEQFFGWDLQFADDGASLVIGAMGDSTVATFAGAVHVWERGEDAQWEHSDTLYAEDAKSRDFLGRSVALDRAELVAGARGRDAGGNLAGAVYAFGSGALSAPAVPLALLPLLVGALALFRDRRFAP